RELGAHGLIVGIHVLTTKIGGIQRQAAREEELVGQRCQTSERGARQAIGIDGSTLDLGEPTVRQAAVLCVEDDQAPRIAGLLARRGTSDGAEERRGQGGAPDAFEEQSSVHGATSASRARYRKDCVCVRSEMRACTV